MQYHWFLSAKGSCCDRQNSDNSENTSFPSFSQIMAHLRLRLKDCHTKYILKNKHGILMELRKEDLYM